MQSQVFSPSLATRPLVPISPLPSFKTQPVENSAELLPRDISSRFGIRLRELRLKRSMTQLDMAIYLGIDRSFISDVERGKKSISLTFLEIIALGMKVSLSELLAGM